MAIKIIFESHSTTIDNENHVSTGHHDIELSETGVKQAKDMGKRYMGVALNTVYCSDLQRSYKTAEIAFLGRDDIKIIKDKRLRECDYGDYTRFPSQEVTAQKEIRIEKPFPNGESYEDCSIRMKTFLDDIKNAHKDGDVIIIVGHRATQYGLDHWLLGKTLYKSVTDPWKWQPGWEYELKQEF
ncbi:MAG: histidine phosphatase family protein [Lactobacillaceae bacterium]|jgi:broad specificity phosphatase PhoE|nr:histidine phosphatase family protein [Lactobacillaceae bacterium]